MQGGILGTASVAVMTHAWPKAYEMDCGTRRMSRCFFTLKGKNVQKRLRELALVARGSREA